MSIRYAVLPFLLLAAFAATAATFRAYPATYELVRVTDSGDQVLASGRVLLREGQTVAVAARTGAADLTEVDVSADPMAEANLRFTLLRPEGGSGTPRLVLISEVDLAVHTGVKRYEVPGSPESFVQGPRTDSLSFRNRSWRRLGDPTPIVVPFEQQGDRYRLTVLFDPVVF